MYSTHDDHAVCNIFWKIRAARLSCTPKNRGVNQLVTRQQHGHNNSAITLHDLGVWREDVSSQIIDTIYMNELFISKHTTYLTMALMGLVQLTLKYYASC